MRESPPENRLEKSVADTIANAKENARLRSEVEADLRHLESLNREFLDGNLRGAELDQKSLSTTERLREGAAIFDTVSEFSLAVHSLAEEGFMNEATARKVLEHENSHALHTLNYPEGRVTYALIFMKNEGGEVSAVQPSVINNAGVNDDYSRKLATLGNYEAPEEPSEGDKESLPKINQ